MIPSWTEGLAREWGHRMRKFEATLGNVQGTMGRIREEGPEGAAIRGQSDHLPDIDFPNEVRKFHLAWLDLDYPLQAVIWAHYRERGKVEKKAEKMGMSKSTFYNRRSEAMIKIAVDFHLYD